MSKEKRERAIAQNGNEGTHYTMSVEELQMLTETFTNDYVEQDVSKLRKETPVFSGVLKYFPDAIAEVAKCSFAGQQQHNPNKPLAWDRSKSGDEYDALMRHLMDSTVDDYDTDGTLHKAKVAWRALAGLQKHLEKNKI
jgi:malonyl CoA-acyl carrier protein transacylase